MKAVLTDERFSRPGLDLRAQARRDPLRRDPRRRGRPAALAQRPVAERPLPRGRRRARRPAGAQALRRRRRGRRLRRQPQTSFEPLARRGRRARSRSSSTCSTCSGSTATTSAPLPLRARKRLLRDALAFARAAAPHAAPQPRRRGAVRGGLPQGLGGPDRQARRQPVLDARARSDWLKFKCEHGAGARDRRLHGAEGLARASSARCCSATTTTARFRYAGKVGTGFDRETLRDLGARLRPLRRDDPPFADADAIKRARRDLGRARARRPGRLHRVDARRAAAPSALPRPARRQGAPERWCGRNDGRDPGRPPVRASHPSRQGAVPAGADHQARPGRATTSASRR